MNLELQPDADDANGPEPNLSLAPTPTDETEQIEAPIHRVRAYDIPDFSFRTGLRAGTQSGRYRRGIAAEFALELAEQIQQNAFETDRPPLLNDRQGVLEFTPGIKVPELLAAGMLLPSHFTHGVLHWDGELMGPTLDVIYGIDLRSENYRMVVVCVDEPGTLAGTQQEIEIKFRPQGRDWDQTIGGWRTSLSDEWLLQCPITKRWVSELYLRHGRFGYAAAQRLVGYRDAIKILNAA